MRKITHYGIQVTPPIEPMDGPPSRPVWEAMQKAWNNAFTEIGPQGKSFAQYFTKRDFVLLNSQLTNERN